VRGEFENIALTLENIALTMIQRGASAGAFGGVLALVVASTSAGAPLSKVLARSRLSKLSLRLLRALVETL